MKQALWAPISHSQRLWSKLAPYFRRKRIILGCSLILALLIASAIISISCGTGNTFLPYEQNIEVLEKHGQLYVAIDDVRLEAVIQAEDCQAYSSSIDGKIVAFLTSGKELYLVKDRQVKKIADDVLHFEISSTGMGVAFAQKYMQQYALTFYDPKEDTRREITDLLSKLDFSLSPDGQSLAYYTLKDDQEVLMCYCKGEEYEICRDKSDLVGLSNEGKHIYAVCSKITGTSALYAYNRRGKATELGTVTSISFKFSADHQQIMFYNSGKTLVSTNGQPAVKVSSYPLYLVTAPNSHSASDGNSITLPINSLFDHVYTCSDGEGTGAWMIRKNPDENQKLASMVSGCTLDESGKYLYFIYHQAQLCVVNISSGNNHIKTLADDVELYTVSSDRSKVYYTSNGTLLCTNGKKNASPKVISDNVTDYSLFMGDSNTAYFMCGSELYRSKGGKKAKLTLQNIQRIYSSSNNVVYIIGHNDVYAAYQKAKPVNILEQS